MALRVNCPACNLACQVADEHLGRAIRCPGCKQPFSVRLPGPPPLPARAARLLVGSATSPGRLRDRNEDSFLVQHLRYGSRDGLHESALLVVADGMGGHDAGDRASALAIAAIAQALLPRIAGLVAATEPFANADEMLDAVDRALWDANRAITAAAEQDGCAGMGATAVAALVANGTAAICHVGDCRAYLWRGGGLDVKTRDQTIVNRMVDLGMLTAAEAKVHQSAGQVTQALGRQYELEPSRCAIELLAGDRVILACDGLHAHLDMGELARLAAADDAQALAEALVRAADEAGGSDNCTVVVVDALA